MDTWQFNDTYHGWLRYPFFHQVRPVKIFRDHDRDTILDYEVPQQVGLFGINIHRMSGNGQHQRYVNYQNVSWSQGCQGAPEPIFRQIVELARISSKFHGNLYTYTLVHSRDLPTDKRALEAPEYYTAFDQ
ncbi:MAG: hypothetical protein NW226_13430 [Microscillaceae bacterium]|nr:hypothetical protein [Microscillaceae bacterium]